MNNKMKLLEDLNAEQKKAVCHTEGPLLILAGAGSGKTRVIVYRLAYLLQEKGVQPWEILGITFTNKASEEMKNRVQELTGLGSELWISTFHALGVRILRRALQEIKESAFTPNFTIYDDQDQLSLIKEVIDELNLDSRYFKAPAIRAAISTAKNELLGPEEYAQLAQDFFSQRVAEVYHLYQKRLRANNAFDFDDLLFKTVEILKENPQILSFYQRKFRYIMIDEYQDTNYAQYSLAKLLADYYRNICVVGDDDQSIYRFRGADIRNILEFERDYPEAKTIKLEENYRSTARILDTAFQIVKKIPGRKDKRLWTRNDTGEKITVYAAADQYDEAGFVTRVIEENGPSGGPYAVLYRTNAQSRVFEDLFIQRNIPYSIYGGLRFYERQEIKDLLAYLRLLVNPDDNLSFRRIVNQPRRGIGRQTLNNLEAFAAERSLSLFAALSRIESEGTIFSPRQRKLLQEFQRIIANLQALREYLPLTELVKTVLKETGYWNYLEAEGTKEALNRLENLNEFLSLVADYLQRGGDDDLESFLQQTALMTDADTGSEGQSQVYLLTLHSAKGLEFPTVFMVGIEEGTFPHSRCFDSEEELAEERRLCYVGITRAERKLYFSYAHQRTLFGETTARLPSRFIQELPEEHLEKINHFDYNTQTDDHLNGSLKKCRWQVGDMVLHRRFGKGEIIGLRPCKDDLILQIRFSQGTKELLAQYASLQKA
jgi:DNA helicase-2/ATP-dependent DNA helicase PcrA